MILEIVGEHGAYFNSGSNGLMMVWQSSVSVATINLL